MSSYNRGYFIKDNQDQEKDHSQNNDTAYLSLTYPPLFNFHQYVFIILIYNNYNNNYTMCC